MCQTDSGFGIHFWKKSWEEFGKLCVKYVSVIFTSNWNMFANSMFCVLHKSSLYQTFSESLLIGLWKPRLIATVTKVEG